MQAVTNWDFFKLSTALSSVLKIQPYMSCPKFHMEYMTKQGTLLSLCLAPLLQGLWSTPESACAAHSPAHCETGQGWVPPASKSHCCCQQGTQERWWNLAFIFWSLQPAGNQLSIRLPSYIQLYRSALAVNRLAWEKSWILSWRQQLCTAKKSSAFDCTVQASHTTKMLSLNLAG